MAAEPLMPIYPTLAVLCAAAVIVLELFVFRSGVMRTASYWISMVIVVAFMIPVDGWLTKLSAPIVIYRESDTSGVRPIWDILIEEYAYAFALLTLAILVWDRFGGNERTRSASESSSESASASASASALISPPADDVASSRPRGGR
ncbi:MAG: lycopene cyclase domain-containing protein [Ilumatobacteraceae bacterium]